MEVGGGTVASESSLFRSLVLPRAMFDLTTMGAVAAILSLALFCDFYEFYLLFFLLPRVSHIEFFGVCI